MLVPHAGYVAGFNVGQRVTPGKNVGVGRPRVRGLAQRVGAVVVDWIRSHRIVLYPVGAADGRPEVQERVHIDLVEEDAEAAADDHITGSPRVPGKAYARSEVVLVRREQGIDISPLNFEALTGYPHRQVLGAIVQRSEVFVAQAQRQVQVAGHLPVVLRE